MFRLIAGIIIYTLISMICFSVYGQGWENEQHVWNEEKQQWDVHNKAVVPAQNNNREVQREDQKFAPPTEEWARFLPYNVRKGKREASSWEISEAQRKLWVKQIMAQRAMADAEKRRQLIAYRKATGWYAARRAGNRSHGWMMQMHMNSVNRYIGGGYNGYY